MRGTYLYGSLALITTVALGCRERQSSTARQKAPVAGLSSAVRAGDECPQPKHVELIDDLDDGDAAIPKFGGRTGYWYLATDNTSPNVPKDPDVPFQGVATGDKCRGLAAHFVGGPFSDWGATIGINLGRVYDASRYVGISFWAKRAVGAQSLVEVGVPNVDTDPQGDVCDPDTAESRCYNHFRSAIEVGTKWKRFEVLFGELAQQAWGNRAPRFNDSAIYGISFAAGGKKKIDFWVDDVAFIRVD